nr:T9SS type A sorting domain-containing protein [uncultured Emticicia sp.]
MLKRFLNYTFLCCISSQLFAQNFTEILGRPTNTSITMSVLFDANTDVYWEYGTETGKYTNKTGTYKLATNTPQEIDFNDLKPNTKYFYRMGYKSGTSTSFVMGLEHTFQMPRPGGNTFSFAVEADPHLDENSVPESLTLTMKNMLAKKVDFMVDLGDNFMNDKLTVKSQEEITKRTALFRPYFGTLCHSAPLFLVLGNHEGEYSFVPNNTPTSMPVLATITRKLFYPNPSPNNFYTGSEVAEPLVGLRENYYAFAWGDAQFIILDPYWYTVKKGDWGWTLGKTQYDWLKKTLSESKSKFKFLFAHQLIGGGGTEARGGSEVAHLFELGGKNADGSYGFDTNRPNWGKPVHELLKEYKATIFFHGHDHFYGKQDKEGIVYQEVPQPSARNIASVTGLEYGYIDGVLLASRGFLLVTVSPENVKVDYVKTFLPSEENNTRKNMDVAHSYTITPNVVTGLKEIAEKEYVKIYPNTAKDYLKVEFLEKMTNYKIRLANMKGQIVSETYENDEIDVSNLPNGVYLLNIVNEKYQFNRKIVVNHE